MCITAPAAPQPLARWQGGCFTVPEIYLEMCACLLLVDGDLQGVPRAHAALARSA